MVNIAMVTMSALAIAPICSATEPLNLLYESRPPFAHKDANGKLIGLVPEAIEAALKRAGIAYQWIETPFKRQISLVEQNQTFGCAVGLYMTPERQRYAKFSTAILHDKDRPSIVLAHQDFKIPPALDLMRVLSLPNARLLKKEDASYGPAIDEAIERSRVHIVSTTADAGSMARMLIAHRADFVFVSEEEALVLIKETKEGSKLRIYAPNNMPQGQDRYLMCSQKVPDQLLHHFNRALVRPIK